MRERVVDYRSRTAAAERPRMTAIAEDPTPGRQAAEVAEGLVCGVPEVLWHAWKAAKFLFDVSTALAENTIPWVQWFLACSKPRLVSSEKKNQQFSNKVKEIEDVRR
jgi:hypothetical protein